MRVLVTGASGFVGKNLLEHPAAAEHSITKVRRFDLDETGWVGDYDVLIHLAGRVGGIQDNIAHPVDFLLDNLKVGMAALDLAQRCEIPRMINLGSSCMYPVAAEQPFREESLYTGAVEPTNEAYATAKLTIAKLCQYYGYKTLIPPGLYGPHAPFSGDRAHLVGAVMDRIHYAKTFGSQMLPVWGDGTARREFLFAPDLAGCIWRAVGEYDSLPDVMNVGTGTDLSVDEWVHEIAAVVGWEGRLLHDPSKPSGSAKKVMDVSRAADWGWTAPTPLKEGLAKTYNASLNIRAAGLAVLACGGIA